MMWSSVCFICDKGFSGDWEGVIEFTHTHSCSEKYWPKFEVTRWPTQDWEKK